MAYTQKLDFLANKVDAVEEDMTELKTELSSQKLKIDRMQSFFDAQFGNDWRSYSMPTPQPQHTQVQPKPSRGRGARGRAKVVPWMPRKVSVPGSNHYVPNVSTSTYEQQQPLASPLNAAAKRSRLTGCSNNISRGALGNNVQTIGDDDVVEMIADNQESVRNQSHHQEPLPVTYARRPVKRRLFNERHPQKQPHLQQQVQHYQQLHQEPSTSNAVPDVILLPSPVSQQCHQPTWTNSTNNAAAAPGLDTPAVSTACNIQMNVSDTVYPIPLGRPCALGDTMIFTPAAAASLTTPIPSTPPQLQPPQPQEPRKMSKREAKCECIEVNNNFTTATIQVANEDASEVVTINDE